MIRTQVIKKGWYFHKVNRLSVKKVFLLSVMVLLPWLGWAQKAQYRFCVSSDSFQSFKARVTFNSIDFGLKAARQMVYNEVSPALEGNIEIVSYNPAQCPCADTCAFLEVRPKDWDGNIGEEGFTAGNSMGAVAEMTEMLVTESKAFFKDPSGFLMKRIFRRKSR